MNIISTSRKIIIITLVSLLIAIATGLYYLNQYPVSISNDLIQKLVTSRYPGLTIVSENVELRFNDQKLQLISPKLQLVKAINHQVNLEDIQYSLNIWNLESNLTAKIVNSELLTLISIKDQPSTQAMIDDFNNQNHLPFNGDIQLSFNFLQLDKAVVNLTNKDGWHRPNKQNLTSINLNEFSIALEYKDDKLSIRKLQIQYENNVKASLIGDFKFSKNGLSLAEFQTDITDLPIEYLAGLWPKILFPEIHEWVTSHVTGGMIKKARGTFKLTEADFKPENIVPKNAIDAEIEISDASVKYLEEYSPITKIDTIVKFDGDALSINGATASMLNNKITGLNLILPFDKLILSLKANVSGKITEFQEFIPAIVHKKLERYGIFYKAIQGRVNGSMDLTLPISNSFKITDLQLYVKADLDNVIVDKFGLIELKKGTIELTNEADKIKLKINNQNLISFDLTQHHNPEHQQHNQINADAEININKPTNLDKIKLNQGIIRVSANLTNEKWAANIDFSKAEVYFSPLGYTKNIAMNSSIQCVGDIEETQLASENCSFKGNNFAGQLLFTYSYEDNLLKRLILNNANIGPNNFSFQTFADKKFSTYQLTAKNLDLSNISIENSKESLANYKLTFKIDQLLLKNQTSLSNVSGSVSKIGNNPPEMSMSAFSNEDKITLSRAKKNDLDLYSLYSSSAAVFSKAFGIYNNIKKGEIWFEIYPNQIQDSTNYYGNVTVRNFYLTNTSVLTKIILGILSPLNSPQAIAQTLQGGSLKADIFTANLDYKKGLLKISDGSIKGSSYEVKLNGSVDISNRYLDFKGLYIPSFYGINTFISMIPLFGKILAGGDKSAFIAANFEVKGGFDNPNTSLNPLSAFTPGFIRNLFN